MIVTIDGPAGAGKSTIAHRLAERLGFAILNTGAMYRGIALATLEAGISPADTAAIERLLPDIDLHYENDRVTLAGRDVTGELRTPAVRNVVSPISAILAVRQRLVTMQQKIAATGDWVCEGRDQGTVVFPQAERKYFLTASPEERARRRHVELVNAGQSIAFEAVLAEQLERDARDASRDLAPMVPADDAVHIDSTERGIQCILDQMEREVRACWNR